MHNLDQDFEYNMHLLEYPITYSINALKSVIEEVKQNNKNKLIAQFIDTYNYDRGLNVKMQNFLKKWMQGEARIVKQLLPVLRIMWTSETLEWIDIELTSFCNIKCKGCFSSPITKMIYLIKLI